MRWLPRTWIQGSAALRRVRGSPIPPLAAVLALVGLVLVFAGAPIAFGLVKLVLLLVH